MIPLLTLLVLQTDTLRLPAAEVLARVTAEAPGVAAAAARSEAAAAQADQARAFLNPSVSVVVENVGAEQEVTGFTGARGIEGQAVVGFPLRLGGERGALIRRDGALARAADAEARAAQGDGVVRGVAAVAAWRRDRGLLDHARSELATLERLAAALTARAEAGRSAEAEAARARLAVTVSAEVLARAEAAAAASAAELALVLGEDPRTAIAIEAPACVAVGAGLRGADGVGDGAPELALAEARRDAGVAALDHARALRVPDVSPELGLRRTMGTEALYAGLSFQLPLFDRQGRAVDAARAEAEMARLEARDLVRAVEAARAAAEQAFAAHDVAGARFLAPEWAADLERTVEAAEARFELGEGTLVELLEGRRARFEALAAREHWAAGWLVARARVARLTGTPPDEQFFCEPMNRIGR